MSIHLWWYWQIYFLPTSAYVFTQYSTLIDRVNVVYFSIRAVRMIDDLANQAKKRKAWYHSLSRRKQSIIINFKIADDN